MKELIAICGLDCESCDARMATLNDDAALREKTAKLWSELNGVPITPEMIRCEGCRAEGIKTPFCNSLCPIRQCALKRGMATCGDCPEMESCETVGMVHKNNAEAKERLTGQRDREDTIILAQTERLILRRYKKEDLQDLFEYLSDAEVVEYEPYKPLTLDETKENLEWRMGTEEMVAIELKDSHKMIGNVYMGKREFEAMEIGYVLNRNYWGHGYAAESCRALIQQAFSKGIHRIYAECDPRNTRSWKLLEALGFQREAHLRKNVYFWKDENGKAIWKDTYIYAKLDDDR